MNYIVFSPTRQVVRRLGNPAVWVLLSGISLCNLSLAGESAEDPAREIRSLDTITVTANRRERPLREVANSVSVIDDRRLQETLSTSIKDLARYAPWLAVSHDPSRFGSAGFTIRGIEANRVATEIDGVPVSDGFSVGSYSSARRDLVSPVFLKRVEVLRGPASALYGSDAIGGVVSYSTWEPADFLNRTSGNNFLGTAIGYRSGDNSMTSSATVAAGNESVEGLAIAAWQTGSELDNKAGIPAARPNPRDYDNADLFVRLIRHGSRQNLGLSLDFHHAEASTSVDDLEGQGRFASTTLLEGEDRQKRNRVSLDGSASLQNSLADDWEWRLYYQEGVTDQRSVEERAGSSRSPSPTRRFPSFEYRQAAVGGYASATREFSTDLATHRMLFGLQLTRNRIEELRDNRLINLDDGSVTDTVLGETFPVRDFPASRVTEAAIFIHDEILLSEERLTVMPALRVEHYDLEPRPDQIYRDDNPMKEVVAIRETSLSPKLGFVYHVNENASLFAQYAHGFRSPPLEDANIGLEIPLFNVRAIPNPDLKPESSDGLELGLRLSADKLRGTVSLFNNEYRDFIDSRVFVGPDPVTGVLTFQSLNRDRARIYGGELEIQYDLGRHLPGWSLQGGLAMTRGEDRDRKQPLNAVDPDRAVLGLRFDDPGQKWGIELLGTFAAAKTRADESVEELFKPPGHGVLDLLAYRTLWENATLNVGLFNIGDKKYWDWSDVRGRPADDPLIDFYTRPGFNFAVTLRQEW